MATSRERNKYYREKRWFDGNREEVLKRDGYACTRCGSKGSVGVHHRDGKGRGYHGAIDNSMDNLITLCNKCHSKLHGDKRSLVNKKSYLLGVARHWDKSDRAIGRILGCSHTTVREIRKSLARKLGMDPAIFAETPD